MSLKRLFLMAMFLPVLLGAGENTVVAKLRARAERGVAGAQYNLAELYASGTSVPKDEGIAAAWYRKAAEQGLRDAQFSLAMAYLEGVGVTKDKTEGLAWLKVAVVNGGVTMARFRDKLEEELSPLVVAAAERRCEVIQREIAATKRAKNK